MATKRRTPSKKGMLNRLRKKKMDENKSQDIVTPEVNEVQPQEVNNVDVVQLEEGVTDVPAEEAQTAEKKTDDLEETAPVSEPTVEPTPKGLVDPSFDCPQCQGEGLVKNNAFPEGRVCIDCNGTGKQNKGING